MPQQAVAALTLLLVCIMSASVRLFSVIKYESVIHEFDPYFNYRVTQFLTKVRNVIIRAATLSEPANERLGQPR